MRVLLIKLKHLGDTLLLTPTIRFLKATFPDIQIDVIVRASCEPLLESNPDVSRVFAIARPESQRRTWWSGFRENLRLIGTVATTSYDYAFDLSDSDRAKIWVMLSRAKVRGFRRIDVKPSWKHRVFNRFDDAPMVSLHQVGRDFETVTRIMGVSGTAGPLSFHPRVDESALSGRFAWMQSSKPYVVIHPTSRWAYKEWLPERWAEVADRLAALGYQVVLSGGPESREAETVALIQSAAKSQPVSIAGQVSLHEFGFILGRARMFLGIDTLAMHLAAAMRTPTVALFGPSVISAWTPWGVRAEVVSGPCSCNPSNYARCAPGHTPCMTAISVSSVMDAVGRLAIPASALA
jgi:heptosyltransferase-3